MKAMKFIVANKEQSEALQEILFKEGYAWGRANNTTFRCTTSKYLFAYKDGNLTHSNYDQTFNFDTEEYKKVDTESYISANSNINTNVIPVVDNKPDVVIVEVLGKLYAKTEVVEALSKLNQYKVEN